jgi:hypothetical protein
MMEVGGEGQEGFAQRVVSCLFAAADLIGGESGDGILSQMEAFCAFVRGTLRGCTDGRVGGEELLRGELLLVRRTEAVLREQPATFETRRLLEELASIGGVLELELMVRG